MLWPRRLGNLNAQVVHGRAGERLRSSKTEGPNAKYVSATVNVQKRVILKDRVRNVFGAFKSEVLAKPFASTRNSDWSSCAGKHIQRLECSSLLVMAYFLLIGSILYYPKKDCMVTPGMKHL